MPSLFPPHLPTLPKTATPLPTTNSPKQVLNQTIEPDLNITSRRIRRNKLLFDTKFPPPPPPPPLAFPMPPGGSGPRSPRRQDANTASSDAAIPASKVLFGKYEIGRLLGCGAFAKVYNARDVRTNARVAIKCISKLRILKSNLSSSIMREVAIMRRLRHPNIVRLVEVLASSSKIYFVMELVKGGELFARVAAKGRLSESKSRRYFQELISAVSFCHSRGVYHRDLKPENILLDEHGNVKVSDFGLSAVAEQIKPDGMFHTVCGTPAYVAPEVLIKKGYDGAKVDIWSCGVILFVLNAGYLPFNETNLMQMYKNIYRGVYKVPKWMSPELRTLISRLLDTNPATRISMEGIINDPWFKKGLKEDKMRAMMSYHSEVDDRLLKFDQDAAAGKELNAFDIISLSSGFNLSGLFDGRTERSRFVSDEPGDEILNRVEEIGRMEGHLVRKRKEKAGKGGVAVEGQNGNLVVWVEVFRLSPELVMVEVEKGEAEDDEKWSSEFWRERLGPVSEPCTPVGRGKDRDVFGRTSASEPVSPRDGRADSGSEEEIW